MSTPIALGRMPLRAVVLATLCAIAAALVLVALGEGGVPDRLQPAPAPTAAAPPPPAPVFEPNRGQADPAVEFLARGSDYTLFLTGTAAVLALEAGKPGTTSFLGDGTLTRGTGMEPSGAVVRMGLAGANPHPEVAGRARRTGTASYMRGDDPARWRTGIPTFGRVHYAAVYPGIDMAWYGNSAGLEYDFEVAPGADPSRIGLTFAGAESVSVDGRDLVVETAVGQLRHQPPFAYQESRGVRERVEATYALRGDGTVGFELGSYDRTRPLVIDPQLVYSTLLGGTGSDRGTELAVDAAGHAYIVGSTDSTDYPTTSGAFRDGNSGDRDAFVSKLSQDGSSLVYSTYLGTGGQDEGTGIAIDADGHAYVTGRAAWSDFPTTPGAFAPNDPSSTADVFVAKLSADGSSLDYASYLGGRGIFEDGATIAVDADGSAYVAGSTDSDDFPTTPGSFQASDPEPGPPAYGFDSFVTKFSPDGSGLEWSSYLGSAPGGDGAVKIALEGENAFVTGTTGTPNFPTTPGAWRTSAPSAPQESDAFAVKLAADGSGLEYGTYIGGDRPDNGHGVAVRDGVAYVGGYTQSTNFPTTPGAYQETDPTAYNGSSEGFALALKPDGSGVEYSTYLGGAGGAQWDEGVSDLTVDDAGRAVAVGRTDSAAFPTTPGAFQEADPGTGNDDAFVAVLSPAGDDLEYGTYLGGTQGAAEFATGVGLDGAGDVYVGGLTAAANFPTTEGAYQTAHRGSYDAFVTKLHPERDDPTPPRAPTTLELAPDTAVNTVGTQHCVTATVRDQHGNASEGVAVWFAVSGSSDTSGGSPTDAEGRAQFCYDGPAFPGSDTIAAYADTDGDATQDEGEPSDSATKDWVLAAGSGSCKVTGGGTIVTEAGDRATFAVGGGTYVDHGPAQPLRLKSLRELVVICDGNRVTIYGEARVEGQGTRLYRLELTDWGEPGRPDTYSILLDTGYASGERPLTGGNVQVR